MKPNFALTLSFDGIGLLHRAQGGSQGNAAPGWERVGEVPLDVPDLQAALALLKSSASELTDDTITSKLILPDDQIKYLSIVDPQGSEDIQAEAVRHALDGATPYALDELAYDWEVDGEMLHIAAVAKETLAEAEGFAKDNNFEPLYFAAIPAQGQFSKEPNFGTTQFYESRSSTYGALSADTEVVKIVGIARPPEAKPETQPEAAPVADEPEAKTEPHPAEKVQGAAPAEQAEGDPEHPSAPAPSAPEEPTDAVADDDPTEDDTAAADNPAHVPEVAPVADESFAVPIPPEAPSDAQIAAAKASTAPAFSTRRSASHDETSAPKLSGVSRAAPNVVAPSIPIEAPDPQQAGATLVDHTPAEPASAEGGVMSFFSRRSGASAPSERPAAQPKEPRPKRAAGAGFSLQSLRGSGAQQETAQPAPPPNVIPPHSSEQQRLTVFGARKPERAAAAPARAIGGKPRFLGLILTAVLLVFLIGVAAWASIFVDEGLSRLFRGSETRLAFAPDAEDETLVEGEEAALPDGTIELASLDPDLPPRIEPQILPRAYEEISPEEARVKYAVTGIWMLPPDAPEMPAIEADDDLYVASIDHEIGAQDAIALPPLPFELNDNEPRRQSNPSAQGERFTLDARGLVTATPDGTRSPDGHMVFLGKPAYYPTVLPKRAEAANPEDEASAKLAAFRPKLRPEGLIERNERATLGGFSLKELASIRPKKRPPSVRELAEARQAEENAKRAEAEAAEKAAAVPQTAGAVEIKLPSAAETAASNFDPNATAQAVARSVKPKNRPRNFSRIVKRAEKNAERNTESVTRVAAVAPKTVKPRIPSTASVAKQATVRNAINLRRVNLIGVYGKPSSRRALVRLANGRYKKVKVGDRIDGGRISAISDAELRYQKNGRNVTLKMPRG